MARHVTLLKRIICLSVAAVLFYQWIAFSLDYGAHPYGDVDRVSYDHLFHHDKSKLDEEVKEILQGREEETPPVGLPQVDYSIRNVANLTFDLSHLETTFGEDWHWQWIWARVKQLWPEVCEAAVRLAKEEPESLRNRTRLRVLVLPGVLSLTDFAHPDRAFHGGPVGELTQWADLVATLYLLGHDLELRWDIAYAGIDLGQQFQEEGGEAGCASRKYDLIYTDLGGHSNLPAVVKEKYRLKFRVLDAYGSEVMYNVGDYARAHGTDRSAGMRDLDPRQFMTMYPEVPDNSFAGFIISSRAEANTPKENIGVLYGKQQSYLRGRRNLISSLRQFMEIHATLSQNQPMEENGLIINHGVMRRQEYTALVNKAKYFIGLGDPIEGPGLLEAVTRGCVVIQPLFKQHVKLAGKPNNRTMTSQVPYLERIGPPHVYTLDYDDVTQVLNVIARAQQSQVSPLLPVEFSAYGYLQRLNAYVQKQHLCGEGGRGGGGGETRRWPPARALRLKAASRIDESCSHVCDSHGLVCENSFFDLVNSSQAFADLHFRCESSERRADVFVPSYIPAASACLYQGDGRLYSCASYGTEGTVRVCPCRTVLAQQRALCEECV